MEKREEEGRSSSTEARRREEHRFLLSRNEAVLEGACCSQHGGLGGVCVDLGHLGKGPEKPQVIGLWDGWEAVCLRHLAMFSGSREVLAFSGCRHSR